VIGGGPGGLEAARVAAERGHSVTLLEAATQVGGQIQLLVRNQRRKDLIGIVDWRVQELERLDVDVQCNVYAELEDVLACNPDVVIVATGGYAQSPALGEGADLVTSSWDILSGDEQPAKSVLVYDDSGSHAGMSVSEVIANANVQLELISPERFLSPDMGGLNFAGYMRTLQSKNTTITGNTRLLAVHRNGNRLQAVLGSDFDSEWRGERIVDQVVVEHGTTPADDVYFSLKPLSKNLGAIDYKALTSKSLKNDDIFPIKNSASDFYLYRIGDAVASRNIHAAIYDATRMGLRW